MYYVSDYRSPIGTLTLAADDKNLFGLWMNGQKYYSANLPASAVFSDNSPVFPNVKNWLDCYFAGENPSISALPFEPHGTDFRLAVWKILCEIPYGTLTTYGEIAKQIAKNTGQKSMSSQAVGGAVAHNPISIIIPCHRVVGSNGSLTGYSGGMAKKIALLELEGIDMLKLKVPTTGTAI